MSFLKVSKLNKSYANQWVNKDIEFDLECGEHCVIEGASGSGKSTFLYLLAGLETCDSGDIIVDGRRLQGLNDDQLAMYRNETVGLIFQFHFLLPGLNCLENILLPSKIGGKYSPLAEQKVFDLAGQLGVSSVLDKYPYQLSGGEQQRVNIVRALSLEPRLLLCDEPTGNLDSANSNKVTTLIKSLANEMKMTLIVVTHDRSVASQFSKKFVMHDGQLSSLQNR